MAVANIRAVITAEDNASKVVANFGKNIDKSNKDLIQGNQRSAASFNEVLVATAGMAVASKRLVGVIDDTVEAANKEQAALTGLNSIAKAFGQSQDEATKAAKALTKDGLLNIADAARGLKNLLQSGFSLPEAVKLMERFKDSAAFGKQAALSFGDAVASATEGIKNGNSILVDNAGVTKNLSIILEEAGFSAQDLMRATTDAGVRQAIFNGILKETNPQVGDAAKLTELYAGRQAQLAQKTFELKSQIGQALQPALAKMLETITPLVEKFAKFATDHPQVTAAILIITTAFLGLAAVAGTLGLAVTALSPVFVAFSGVASGAMGLVTTAVGGATGAVGALSTALGVSNLALAAVAASATFTITMITKLKNAFDDANKSISNTNKSLNSIDSALSQAEAQYKSGKITKERYNAILNGAYSGLPGRAVGGSVSANQPYMVGERGAEMFVPNKSGTIVPNSALPESSVNITIQAGAFMGSQIDARKYAKMIIDAYKESMGMKGVTYNGLPA